MTQFKQSVIQKRSKVIEKMKKSIPESSVARVDRVEENLEACQSL